MSGGTCGRARTGAFPLRRPAAALRAAPWRTPPELAVQSALGESADRGDPSVLAVLRVERRSGELSPPLSSCVQCPTVTHGQLPRVPKIALESYRFYPAIGRTSVHVSLHMPHVIAERPKVGACADSQQSWRAWPPAAWHDAGPGPVTWRRSGAGGSQRVCWRSWWASRGH